ncbi:MAG: lytic transglycosylase domain-containing protein [Methylocella sp.]
MRDCHQPIAVLPRSPLRSPSSFPAMAANTACTSAEKPTRRHRTSLASGMAILVTIGCVMVCGGPAIAQPINTAAVPSPFANLVTEASRRFGIPAAWIRAVIRAESFDDVRAISPKGAIGLMQIMPATWAGLRQRYSLGANPYDAHDNIIAGAAYFRELHDRYGNPGFLAAYNAGPARWEDHLATGRPLPAETRAYLIRLAPIVGGSSADDTVILAAVGKSWTEASLFPAPSTNPPDHKGAAPNVPPPHPSTDRQGQDWTGLAPQSDGLFVVLSNRKQSQ